MSNNIQNRRQFLKKTGKTGLAIAASPLISSIPHYTLSPFQQKPLPYAYDALEPFIDSMTMEIHYSKHAATYAKNLTEACIAENIDTNNTSLHALLGSISKYSNKMRNNAGGHFNHEFFWQLMQAAPSKGPSGLLLEAINKHYGSFTNFQNAFADIAKSRFGSGWAWLIVQKNGMLAMCSTPNQDNPLMDISDAKGTPVLALDVWEHAYYLKYQNKRPDYIYNWWNVVNWDFAQNQYLAAI